MKTKITLIAALSQNNAIGKNGALPWRIPEDLQFFKERTLGKPVIFGRKTFEGCLKKRKLPGRLNLIVTSRPETFSDLVSDDLRFFPDFLEALTFAKQAGTEVMIAGGGEIYRQALPLCDEMDLTHVEREIDGDAFFPVFNKADFTEEIVKDYQDAELPFTIKKYCRKK